LLLLLFGFFPRSKELRDIKEKVAGGGWEPCFCSPINVPKPSKDRSHKRNHIRKLREVASVLLPPWETDPEWH